MVAAVTAAVVLMAPGCEMRVPEEPEATSGESGDDDDSGSGSPTTSSTDSFIPGVVRVKLSPEAAAAMVSEGETKADPTKAANSSSRTVLTKAAATLGTTVTMKRVFPYAGKFEARTHEAGLDRWYELKFDESTPLTKAGAAVSELAGVDVMEFSPKIVRAYDPDDFIVLKGPVEGHERHTRSTTSLPFNDPYFSYQWFLYNDGSERGSIAGCDINVVPAWSSGIVGSEDVIVAVVDGGIQFDHPDLAANMWVNPDTAEPTYGYDFVNDSYVITPDMHGSNVAGIVAAVNNNGIGVCGIAGGDAAKGIKGARLMSCQMFLGDDFGDPTAAIKWGADHGAVISQNSWGFTELYYVPGVVKEAIDYFNKYAGYDENGVQVGPMAGGIVIFSAGNNDEDFAAPAAYDGVVSVSCVRNNFLKSDFSNYGPWADICAPGGNSNPGQYITSTGIDDGYIDMAGTSQACPQVSGAAALLVSKFGGPGFTREQLWSMLLTTTRDISSYYSDQWIGYGLLDVSAALNASPSVSPAPNPVTDLKVEKVKGRSVDLSFSVPAYPTKGSATYVAVYASKSPITSTTNLDPLLVYTMDKNEGETVTTTYKGLAEETEYYFAAQSFGIGAAGSELSDQVTATTEVNHTPSIECLEPTEASLYPNQTTVFHFHVIEPDDDDIFFQFENASKAESYEVDEDNMMLILTVDGSKAAPGTYDGSLNLMDEYYELASIDYSYTIVANEAPVQAKTFDKVQFNGLDGSQQLDLTQYFTDPDEEVLKYEAAVVKGTSVKAEVSAGNLTLTPVEGGYSTIKVTATDRAGLSINDQFEVLVRENEDTTVTDIYPTTVTNGRLTIRTPEPGKVTLQMFNAMGVMVKELHFEAGPFTPVPVDIRSLPAGIYTVKVEFNGVVTTATIVKTT